LGLAAGIEAFCREFQDQHALNISFKYENIPRGIPSDSALCLFRVAQESLRNIKRHSGTDHAQVRLVWTKGKLHLTVCDEGAGFDARFRSTSAGIGIRSMEERLRLVRGSLEVDSKPGRGTIINACVPFEVARQTAT
jgi:signal transduction histidine kinase